VFRLAQHLLGEQRPADALLVAETASRLAPEQIQVQSLARHLAQLVERKARKEQA
jgi:hypothetical protein